MEQFANLNGVGEITEMINTSNELELEKYAHLGALAAITEEAYFGIHAE